MRALGIAGIQRYPLLRVAVALTAGIWAAGTMHDSVPEIWMAGTAGLYLMALVFYFLSRERWCVFDLFLTCFFLGGWRMSTGLAAERNSSCSGNTENIDTESVVSQNYAQAVFLSEPQVHGRVIMARMMLLDGKYWGKSIPVSILRDTVKNKWKQFHEGDGVIVHAPLSDKLFAPDRSYENRIFLFENDCRRASVSLSRLNRFERVRIGALHFRSRILRRLKAEGTDRGFGILAAMTLGDKSFLNKKVRRDFAVTGSSHVLALSGLHLGILYFIFSLFFRRRWWMSQVLVLLAVWAFVVLVGMSASVVRSALLISSCSIIQIMDRKNVTLNTLSFSAVLMLLANPACLYDIGFQLSYLSVFGILVMARRCRSRVVSVLMVSFVAQLSTFPLILYYFGRVSCYGVLISLVVVPAAFVILYGTVAVFITSPFVSLSRWILDRVENVTCGLERLLGWVAGLPGASVEHLYISRLQVALLYIILICGYLLIVKFAVVKK